MKRSIPFLVALVSAVGACHEDPPDQVLYRLIGTVTSEGRPIAGARVRVQGKSPLGRDDVTETDANGNFNLPLPFRKAGDRMTVTAGAVNYRTRSVVDVLPANTPVTVNLPPIPTDDPSYQYQTVDFGNPPCNFCHFDQVDRWDDSQHSRAARDPLMLDEYRRFVAWWQKLDPDGATEAEAFAGPYLPPAQKGDTGKVFSEGGQRYRVLGDQTSIGECAKCHTPAYALRGGQDLRPSVLAGQDQVYSEGVTCDFCHKVKSVKLDTEDDLVLAGIDKIAVSRPGANDQVMFGQYDDVTFVKMQASYSPLFEKSEFCADCHVDAKRLRLQQVDAGGNAVGSPSERLIWGEDTYREWRFAPETVVGVHAPGVQSASGQGPFTTTNNYAGRPLQCQNCHMQDPPPDLQTGERIQDWADPQFNNTRIAVNAEAVPRDPKTVFPHRFVGRSARFIAWATELAATARRENGEVVVDVTVDNRHTGHDFPSGLPDRNALLVVEARTAAGALAQTAGPQVPSWGSGDGQTDPTRDLAGQAGKGWARVLADADGIAPVFYLRAVGDAETDTRLKPGQRDQSTYRFAAGTGPVTVRVRILHRLRFKTQWDRYLQANPGTDPASVETPGDEVTLNIP
ncbi:MAG TPA: multiheme c-type cytochrome [Polyangia bacterium]|nr:multiheme c-type cytochrome [Polyangia bacterium]